MFQQQVDKDMLLRALLIHSSRQGFSCYRSTVKVKSIQIYYLGLSIQRSAVEGPVDTDLHSLDTDQLTIKGSSRQRSTLNDSADTDVKGLKDTDLLLRVQYTDQLLRHLKIQI